MIRMNRMICMIRMNHGKSYCMIRMIRMNHGIRMIRMNHGICMIRMIRMNHGICMIRIAKNAEQNQKVIIKYGREQCYYDAILEAEGLFCGCDNEICRKLECSTASALSL